MLLAVVGLRSKGNHSVSLGKGKKIEDGKKSFCVLNLGNGKDTDWK